MSASILQQIKGESPAANNREIIGSSASSKIASGAKLSDAADIKNENSSDVADNRSTSDEFNPRKSLSQHVWTHVQANQKDDGTYEQVCNYCGKTKTSKQLQTTFWSKHLVDQGKKGCPSCPLSVRNLLASKSSSADVHRAAGQDAPLKKTAAPPSTTSSGGPKQGKRKKQRTSLQSFRQPTIVCICGSQRSGSFNKMLRDSALERLTEEGANVVPIDLKDLNLPLYDPDLESDNFPAAAQRFKNDLIAADGILITCPEYNGLLSPLLLNAITWATRGEGRMYGAFKNKVVSLMSTSPGAMGGMRMLRSLQQMMQDMGAIVVPGNTSIGNAFHVFDRDGRMVDERAFKKISTACYQLVHLTQAHASRDIEDPMEEEVIKLPNMGEYGRADW
ncbi:hypothetical protein ACA910_016525 [Epithemia clementina (nom. ined.)]